MSTNQRGLTLIELLVFIVIIGIAANAMLAVFANLTRSSASLLPDKQAQAIANSMMQTILAQPFSGTNSYNGFNTNGNALSGLSELAPYQVSVTVVPQSIWGVPATRIWQVTVKVAAPNVPLVRLDGLRFDY